MRRTLAVLLLLVTPPSLHAEESSHIERARALALRWEETHPDSRALLTRIFEQADAVRAADRSHKRIEWTAALRRAAMGTEFRADHVYWLARVALDRDAKHSKYAAATLGWVPGADARTALLALREIGWAGHTRSGAIGFAFAERARTLPSERASLLDIATDLPPTDAGRCALLQAMFGLEEGRPPLKGIELEDAVVEAISATLRGLAKSEEALSTEAEALCQALGYAATSEWGPPLARIVERRPKLIESLEYTLRACAAPIDREFLWSLLGDGYKDRHVVALLAEKLGPADRAQLLTSLAPARWKESAFYLRVEMLRRAPMALLDEAVHEALWQIAEKGQAAAGLNVALDTAVEVIARFHDPADSPRLDRLIVNGHEDAGSEALRILMRRSKDPLRLFLAQLDHEDGARRYVAATMLVVDFQSSAKLPLDRSIGTWRKFGEVLERRILVETDEKLRRRQLEALRAANVPSSGSPMHGRTAADDHALAAFCGKLIKQSSDTYTLCHAADLLYWSRVPEAVKLLDTLAGHEAPLVAETAARAAKHVRSRLPD